MTAIRKATITAFGDVSNLHIVDATLAAPAAKEVQVAVIYSGFGGADINMRLGAYPLQKKAPLTPGYSFLGRVVSSGAGATTFSPGAIVTAITVYDSQSTRLNIPEKYLVPVPAGVNLQQAAMIVLDWNTAYGMVVRSAQVAAGQRVFVHGLSGGVGNATMQLCLRAGATVYGTASARNHAALEKQGVHPFVYTDKAWMGAMTELGGADAVFDPLGFESWDESYAILARNGILVGYGGNGGTFSDSGKSRSVVGPTLKLLARNLTPCTRTTFYYITRDQTHYKEDAATLLQWLKDGEIAPSVKSVHDLDDLREAHGAWGKASGMGSMLIRVGDEK